MSDAVLEWMQENLPPEEITRENYLEIAYMGSPPEELDAEAESDLPEQFQLEPPEEFDE